MGQTVRLGPFRGLYASVAGDAPANFAGALLNVRVGDGAIRARYGYRNLAAAPAGLSDVFGLARLQGYGDDSLPRLEWVSIEKRAGVVRPYSVDPATWARTEITNGGAPLSLGGGDWLGFTFGGFSYWVNPGGSPSAYRHEVGTPTSWSALENAAYVRPADAPDVAAILNGPGSHPFDGTEATSSPSASSLIKGIGIEVTAGGGIAVSGQDDDNGGTGHRQILVEFAAPVDLSGGDYLAMTVTKGKVLEYLVTGHRLELRIGGVWHTPEGKESLSDDRSVLAKVVYVKGLAGLGAVEAIRYDVRGRPDRNRSGLGFTLSPIAIGGAYLGALAATDRAWDATYEKRSITYGVRYRNVVTGVWTGIRQTPLDASRFGTFRVPPSCPLGDRVDVAPEPNLQAPFVDDPAGTSFQMQALRADADGTWRVLATLPNTAGQTVRDRYELHELAGLDEAAGEAFVTPDAPPVFDASGFVGGFAYLGGVVWLRSGGRANVRFSEVGDAESLASDGDDVEKVGRAADFTLADDFADEPLGGVQAGRVALILGRQGVYGMAGDYPSQMTPPRKLPGSMGCAGRFAYARYRDAGGDPGVAWLDPTGDNVWFASAGQLRYAGDVQGRPVELSAPIRGTLRRFLLDEQREAWPGLSLSRARMDVDEATGSLWLVLGARAAILRPPSLVDGERQWELSAFALGQGGTVPIPACADPYGATAYADVARSPATLAWASPANAAPGAPVATVGTFLPGRSSHWLQGTAMVPWTAHPAEATITSVKLRVRHRLSSAGAAPTPVVLSAVGCGVLSLTPNVAVPEAWAEAEIDLAALGATVATLNAGLDVRIAYDAVPSDPHLFDSDRWSPHYEYQGEYEVKEDTYGPPTGPDSPGLSPLGENPDGSPIWKRAWDQTPQGGIRSCSQLGIGVTPLFAHTQGTVTMRFAYTGPGTPPYACYLVHSRSQSADGLFLYATHVLDNGLGAPTVHTANPDYQTFRAESSAKRLASFDGGLPLAVRALLDTPSLDRQASPFQTGGDASILVDAAVTLPDPSTVEVESLTLAVCYTVPSAEGERSIAYTAFGQRSEGFVWIRSSGHLDAAEWCPTCGHYVEGTGRDGGLPMPGGFWESARLVGSPRRLARVDVEREGGYPAVGLRAWTDRLASYASASAPQGQRWARFGPGVQGSAHRLRVMVGESSAGVRVLELAMDPLAGPNR